MCYVQWLIILTVITIPINNLTDFDKLIFNITTIIFFHNIMETTYPVIIVVAICIVILIVLVVFLSAQKNNINDRLTYLEQERLRLLQLNVQHELRTKELYELKSELYAQLKIADDQYKQFTIDQNNKSRRLRQKINKLKSARDNLERQMKQQKKKITESMIGNGPVLFY